MMDLSRRSFLVGLCATAITAAAKQNALPFDSLKTEWHHYALKFKDGAISEAMLDGELSTVGAVFKNLNQLAGKIGIDDGQIAFYAKAEPGRTLIDDLLIVGDNFAGRWHVGELQGGFDDVRSEM